MVPVVDGPARHGGAAKERDSGAERGSGTMLGLAVIGVVLVVVLAVAGLAGSLQARSAAQSAADLGAIAGAQLLHGPGGSPDAACARARTVVATGGAVLEACRVAGGVVEVRATVAATRFLTATAAARAGRAGP